jgi:alpha-1,3-rhamnosyltransferase
MSNSSNPLVSIVVITYNSSSYVIETLESIKAQTYQNIELIVSDDCSKDKTVDVCKKWIEKNKQRFVRTELITIEKRNRIKL